MALFSKCVYNTVVLFNDHKLLLFTKGKRHLYLYHMGKKNANFT